MHPSPINSIPARFHLCNHSPMASTKTCNSKLSLQPVPLCFPAPPPVPSSCCYPTLHLYLTVADAFKPPHNPVAHQAGNLCSTITMNQIRSDTGEEEWRKEKKRRDEPKRRRIKPAINTGISSSRRTSRRVSCSIHKLSQETQESPLRRRSLCLGPTNSDHRTHIVQRRCSLLLRCAQSSSLLRRASSSVEPCREPGRIAHMCRCSLRSLSLRKQS